MVFICSKAQPDAETNLSRRVETIARARKEGTAGIFDGNAQTLIGATSRARRPGIVTELRAQMTLAPDAVVAVQAGLGTRPDSVPIIGGIDAPILAICGGEDPGITPDEMRAFQAAPGGCEFHLLPEAGHFAAYEEPNAVASLIRPWMLQFSD
jgi:pimeloyl-ACP methyl ester carboxylesterase